MNIRRTLIVCAAVMVAALPSLAGNQTIKNFTLFVKANTSAANDTTEQATIWIPVKGGARVYIRTFSAGAAADTDFCDSIATWKTLFSDSVSFIGRDSLGTLVTARSSMSSAFAFPVCADSVSLTGTVVDSVKMVEVVAAPVTTVPLTSSKTGSGRYTIVVPVNTAGFLQNGGGISDNMIAPSYMRIRFTPRTRLTTAGFSSTAGLRTRGINGLRMYAQVVYSNQ